MAGRIDARLAELGIALPEAAEPRVANILTTKISNGFLFVSGQVTRWQGELQYLGKLGREFSLEEGQHAARLSALNVLAQAHKALDGDLDRIAEVVKLKAYINAMPDFVQISEVANGASDLMIEVFGEAGRHSRTAIGVAVMPFGVALEVEAIFRID